MEKRLVLVLAAACSLAALGETVKTATQPWVLRKIDETVGTNVAARISSATPGDYAAVSNKAYAAATKDALDAEATARQNADDTLATQIGAEAARAKAAEALLTPLSVYNALSSTVDDLSTTVATKADSSALSSYALKTDLSSLAPLASLTSHTSNVNNPHAVTAAQVGAYSISEIDAKGYLTSFTESDPTVHAWAKATSKPTYTASDVGAVPTTRTVNSKALSADITLAASDVGAYSSTDGAALANRVTQTEADVGVLTAYVSGTDAALTITNYNSSTEMPAAELAVKIEDEATGSNVLTTVWRELTRWDAHNAAVDVYTNAVNAALAEKADKAWGLYDSETGNAAPDGYTSISSERVVLGGGMSYMEVKTTGSSIWVLAANAPYEPMAAQTNGTFQVRDADGNALIEIVKGDKAVVPAQPSSVTTENSATTLVVGYDIISDAHPTGEVCLDLTEQDWKSETAADCPATVVWSGASGAWQVRVTPTTATATCFFRATYEVGGETYVKHNVAIGMSEIVLNGTTYTLGTATIDGHTVLTLTPKN